jgi:hypothetical protein
LNLFSLNLLATYLGARGDVAPVVAMKDELCLLDLLEELSLVGIMEGRVATQDDIGDHAG